MRGLDQAVEHGVGNGRIADVPMRNRQLAGDHGGGAAVSVVDDLQHIAPLVCGRGFNPQSSRISTYTRARLLSMRA